MVLIQATGLDKLVQARWDEEIVSKLLMLKLRVGLLTECLFRKGLMNINEHISSLIMGTLDINGVGALLLILMKFLKLEKVIYKYI